MPKSSKRTVCHVLLASVVFFLCTRLSVAQECITEFDKIKLCFEENYEILPGPPINIAASNITGFSAMISWDKPARLRCNNVSADILQCFEEGLDILPKAAERVRVEELNSPGCSWRGTLRGTARNITQYNVFHYHGNSATQPDSGAFMYVTIPPVTTSYMFTGLQPGQMYVLHVQSMNAHGTSLPSYALEVWTPPLEDSDHNLSPRRLQLIDAGVGNLTVTWQPPIKQLPVHYIVRYKQVSLQPSSNVSALNDTAWYQVKLAGYRTNLTIDNLDQDTKYDIYVSAINSEQRVADSPHILSRTIAKKSPRVRIVAILQTGASVQRQSGFGAASGRVHSRRAALS
ncbi:PREDICTED: uncharacterized protein LOC106805749 [Priapulus caudatus]|uniref:Uncharacterized protein LOC106805749 n=1 Tax=Priapulus caudatus TaxID=37621 RepID=A0ABM1DSM9_PRICU|nr:PREDICTED: uncharacterized protein LOC106805749 [Priapulus caudatus]